VSETISSEAFALEARRWLRTNMEARSDQRAGMQRGGHRTPEDIARQRTLQRTLHDGGYAGITWPRTYGGRGLTVEHEQAFEREASQYVMPDFGTIGGTTMLVCGPTLLVHASEEFKRRHIPRILAGDELWVQLFSEPGAGSDLAAVVTSARPADDGWTVDGEKVWTSGARDADFGLCLARTDWSVPKHRGLSWFAVPFDTPGVAVRPIREINGSTEFCSVVLEHVGVAADHLIGEVNQGWTVTRTMLTVERLAGDPDVKAPGPRRFASDLVALATREQRLGEAPIRQAIAAAHVNDVVQQAFRTRVAAMHESGRANSGYAAYGKLASGVYNPIRARIGLEICRTSAIAWRSEDVDGATAATDYLNGRIYSIAGGTNEMQRNGIGEGVLGLPREPAFDLEQPFSEVVRNAARFGTNLPQRRDTP
jgi:alkylation response protein AidB-like acyl-CoA dehydrogenase